MRASGSARTRRCEGRRSHLPSFFTSVRNLLLILLPAAVLTPIALIAASSPASAVPPTMTMSLTGPGEIIAGDDATYSFSATNTGTIDGFNLGFFIDVPDGIGFVSSSLGDPVIYDATNPPPTPLPAGISRWVWEDVADLPVSGIYGGTVTVHAAQPVPPDATGTVETSDVDVFPVGSTYTLDGYAALCSLPTYLPVFNGSTGVGGPVAEAETAIEGPSTPSTDVVPFEITKTEPSPEAELLRGVHDQTTVYTIQVRNTTEGPTQNTILVDFIPAGLEFLGCGGIDNTTVDRGLGDGTINEYDNSPDLTGTPVIAVDCPVPVSVETVIADAAQATTYGVTAGEVYTVVTWDLGTLAAGETRTVHYAAAIPLYENTTTWDGVGGEPTPASLGQTANLDNNNGPSTRHGDPATPVDGDTWTNVANVFGDYYGIVRTGTDRSSTDRDDQTVFAMDLSILKDITGGSTTFEVNTTTEFTLTLRESEYMNSEDIVVTDTIPNGLCPLMPAGTPLTEHDGVVVTPECLVPGTVTGAEMVSVDAYGDGTFVVVFRPTSATYPDPDDFILGENETHDIVFDVLNRDEYELAPSVYGPTTSGDGFGNEVEFTATSFAVPDLTSWFPAPWQVWDDSGESLGSDYTTISKLVMPRDEVIIGLPSGENPCTSGTFAVGPELGFRMGDTVCFQLTVNFPTSIDVRNPVVTDFLPIGLEYAGHEINSASTVPPGEIYEDASAAADGRLQWQLGHLGDLVNPDLYVTRGQVLVIDLWATVVAPSSGPILDKPENLLKYRQQNVEGVLYFLRDEADIEIDPELELIKGVLEVEDNASGVSSTRPALSEDDPDGTVFGSNRDGIEVREGEVVTYRVDLRTMPYPAEDAVIWDALAPGITAADVSGISDGGVAYDPGDPGYPTADIDPTLNTRSVIIWTGIDVPYILAFLESRYTLTYDVTVPVGASVSTSYDNDASIIKYAAGINTSALPDAQPYYPTDSFDVSLSGSWNTPGTYTRDDSNVYVSPATIAKDVTSPVDGDNATNQAVKGEIIEFFYTVTIPAHTSVQNGVISDTLVDPQTNWSVHPSLVYVDYPGGSTAPGDPSFMIGADTFNVGTSNGTVTFPTMYVNDTDADQEFTVHLFVHITSTATWGHSASIRRNDTARFASDTQPDITAVSGIYAIAPNPIILKEADDNSVTAGQTVMYTLTARNNNSDTRPDLFDTVVVDCVPPELTGVVLGAPTQGSAAIVPDVSCSGTRIEWNVGELLSGDNHEQELTYTATVSPASAGLAVYTNPATITGYSLDDPAADRATYTASTTESITVLGALLTKDVDAPTATIGEERDFTVTVTLPADVNFYDTALIDDIPSGMTISGVNLACTYGAGGDCMGDLPPGSPVALTPSGTNQGWWLGDILSYSDTRTITLTYTGTVLDVVGNVAGVALIDSADLRWSTENLILDPPADASYTPDVGTLSFDATVVVVEPDVVVDKLVNGVDSDTVAPGETFTYSVEITNEGSSTAYAVTVEDTIPVGVVVDEPSISDGGTLSGEDPVTGGGTISWSLASLATGAGNAYTFTYDAVLAPSANLDGSNLVNTAEVTGFTSHPLSTPGYDDGELRTYTGPTDDATVTPGFPDPDVVKTPAAGPAYIGQPHSFTIVVTNNGASAANDIEVVDTLPADWIYDAGSTTVDSAPAADPAIAGQDLTWTLPLGFTLDPTEFVTIVYTARPDATASWTVANTGSSYHHTNDVDVTVTDDSNASGNSVGPYEDSTSAWVTIDRADVAIDKAHVGSPTAGASFSWTVTVTNNGPDTSVGPFEVVDTLPPDATYTGFTGTGWTYSAPIPGQVTFTHVGPLTNGDALPIITVTVTLPDDLAYDTNFDNSVTVTSETLDLDMANNTDDDPASTVVVADVAIDKTSVGAPFTAGEAISWDIVVTNNGPSIASGPFSVTDTLPATVDWGSVTWSGTGWACNPVTVGGVLNCSWSGAALGVSSSLPTLSVDATILAGTTGTIDNTVSVTHPTPDPEPANDTDSTSDPVGTSADLSLNKTTVSLDIPANGTGRFRIEIHNDGPSDALDVAVADTLPGGLTYLGNMTNNSGDTWSCVPDGGDPSHVDCTLDSGGGTLPAGASTWFEFDVNADATVTGTVLNSATAASTTPDPDGTNNTDDSRTAPTLIVNKTVLPGTVERGSTVTYTINVESTSYGSTDDVVLTDPIPSNLRVDLITVETSTDPTVPDWLSCDLTGTDANGYGGTLTCILGGDLERGRTTPNVIFTATVNPATTPGSLTNTATAAWTDPYDLAAGVFTAVNSVPLDVTLTAGELAATGIIDFSGKIALTLILVALGAALVRLSRRYRTQ